LGFACSFVSDRLHSIMEIALFRTKAFDRWLTELDSVARRRILTRLDRVRAGNFGDCKSLGDGISELRIQFGLGYRIYFMQRGPAIYLLLQGGDKDSQARDIERAREMAREPENDNGKA
jgi:putative addiction module killer protein